MAQVVLKIENVVSRLLTSDQKIKDLLSNALRFRPKGYFHNPRYQSKKWDGYKYFFEKKNGAFLTGLLPEIVAALQYKKIDFNLIDSRQTPTWKHSSIDKNFLNNYLPKGFNSIELHDFQPDLVNKAIEHGRGIIKAPTGAGKTFILISILKSLPPKTPTLFLTKNKGLVHQNWKEMQSWGVENLGRWYGGFKEPNYVTCATIHKATFESLEKLLPKFKALIVDEVHDCVSSVPIKAYKKMDKAIYRIGISATPFKYNKKKVDDCHKWLVKGHFGPVFKTSTTESGDITTKELQDRGILANSDCYFYPINSPQLIHEPYQDAVKMGIEQNFYFHETVARLAKSCPGRTLIVVERIEQGEYLKSLIPESNFIQGGTKLKDREPILNSMLAGEKSIAIVMRQIITAGINVKIHDLINASGGEAAHNVIQLMGRGLRTANDKAKLRYHDFLFLINDYLRKHSEWRIEVIENEGHELTIKDKIDF